MRHLQRSLPLAMAALSGLMVGCSGRSPGQQLHDQTPAPILRYQDPAATGFRLVAEPATNGTPHLGLKLVGPSGTVLRGVAFYLEADVARVAWAQPTGGQGFLLNGGSFDPGHEEPKLARAKVSAGVLQAALFQREGPAVTLGDQPVLSLALTAAPGAAQGAVTLRIPDPGKAVYLDAARVLQPLTIAVGTLAVEAR